MATQRPRGYGSVQKDGNGHRAYGTELQPDGSKKPVRKRFSTEKAAWDWLESLNHRNKRMAAADGSVVPETVADLMRAWLVAKVEASMTDGKPDEKTINEYQAIIMAYLLKPLGKVALDDPKLKTKLRQLKLSINDLVSDKTSKPLSASRKRNIWTVLRSAFRHGVKEGWLSYDMTASVPNFAVPAANPREKVVPKAEVKKLRKFLEKKGCDHKNHVCRLRWELALHSGRRQGEILGLSWSDLILDEKNPKKSIMEVNNKAKARPWKHGCGEDEAGEPNCEKHARYCPKKHSGGIRLEEGTKGGVSVKPIIPLDEDLVSMFIEHRKKQQAEYATAVKLRTIDKQATTGLVFTQARTQLPYGARHDATIFERVMKAADIKGHFHIHQLRHTAATTLSDANHGNIPVIADILGHKSISTTMGYIGPNIDASREAFEAVKKRRQQEQ